MANPLQTLTQLLSRMPPEGLSAVDQLLKAVLNSKDPMRAARLAAIAAASKTATEAAIEAALKKLAK
jgi:hypothetical protein